GSAGARSVSSIVSSASVSSEKPRLSPAARETTLLTPSAATTSFAANARPSTVRTVTPPAERRTSATRAPSRTSAPAARARSSSAPPRAQRDGWSAIASGRDTLVIAPTGSGKTLAAFLWALDRLHRLGLEGRLEDRVYVVYVSPLRALNNDIEKNLRAPL